MLTQRKMLLKKGATQIDHSFDKLITYYELLWKMAKAYWINQATSFDDVFDAFGLSMKYYEFEE